MNQLSSFVRRSPARRAPFAVAACVASSAAIALLASAPAYAAAASTTLEGKDVKDVVKVLVGGNIAISDAKLTSGRAIQAGTYSGLNLGFADRFSSGVALTTGSLRDADPNNAADVDFTDSSLVGPNKKLTTTGDLGGAGSATLDAAFGVTTYDGAELALTVIPAGDTLTIDYQIGSEEYGKWAQRDYKDAFGIFVNGTLCSTIGGQPVGLGTINSTSHPELFVSNVTSDGHPGALDTEMNGFSVPLTCTASVTPGRAVSVVAAVADTKDGQLDSTLLIPAGGIHSAGVPATPAPTSTSTPGSPSSTTQAPVPASANSAASPTSSLASTGLNSDSLIGAVALGVLVLAAGVCAFFVSRRARRATQGKKL
ncbi:choice-of-anchor L domain-containing protein [Microbacterium trichothecenolyticum]|uniref:LPXTG-motif cell wall-anchored protein n=1 Tax=Microbacterium trichothecenolyticum TaxID=69370 RepID=A0ABU0TUD3_MICTR|nr:choice-of-anchor L domain-containing protein [Microbacterium trichothecenolyticum]MDQ1123268.1 hypothetical protein [Microbacterium trichothecenolyticum]